MGTSSRIFFINKDDTLRRIPFARYERLMARDPVECFPEYRDKNVKTALAFVEFYNRKPYELIAIQYSLLSLDGEGRIDVDDFEKGMHLGAEMLTPAESDPDYPNVVDAHILEKLGYRVYSCSLTINSNRNQNDEAK